MKKIVEYKVIKTAWLDLNRAVNEYLQRGNQNWEPLGPIVIGREYMYQTVVRYEIVTDEIVLSSNNTTGINPAVLTSPNNIPWVPYVSHDTVGIPFGDTRGTYAETIGTYRNILDDDLFEIDK